MSNNTTGKAPPRILITSGRVWSALAVTRAFGRLGCEVDVADHSKRAIARFSRYCRRFHQAPNLTTDPAAFGRFIVELAKKNRYAFIVPLFEEVIALSRFKEELARYSKVLLNDFDTYMTLHNKCRLNDFCTEHGLRTPWTTRLDTEDAVTAAFEAGHQFPLFLKHPVSCAAAGVTKISNRDQLARALDDLRGRTFPDSSLAPVLQRGIDGYQIATQAVFKDGELLALHMYRNLAEFPPGSGSGVVRESVMHRGIEATMRKLGRKLNYEGLLGVDFLIEPDSDEAYLIDANPRLPLGFQNAQVSGAHLLEAYASGVTGKARAPSDYRKGVRSRSLVGHLFWLFASLCKLRENPVEVFRTYFRDRRGSHPEVFDRHDLAPILVFPWIVLMVQFQRGETVMDKFLQGANFTAETVARMGV